MVDHRSTVDVVDAVNHNFAGFLGVTASPPAVVSVNYDGRRSIHVRVEAGRSRPAHVEFDTAFARTPVRVRGVRTAGVLAVLTFIHGL